MNQVEVYQELIMEGIQELPPESLSEIMDFVYFIRKKTLQSHLFDEEIKNMKQALNIVRKEELAHLEAEFENYQALYPHE